jgi:hypothetical protein
MRSLQQKRSHCAAEPRALQLGMRDSCGLLPPAGEDPPEPSLGRCRLPAEAAPLLPLLAALLALDAAAGIRLLALAPAGAGCRSVAA